ncbi:MAG: sigma-70 family RNA polymerase sigma factor [Alphaproteobacteria bacterium]|nr:sigma-70 family RNA polymerase sigma factor [Alphaproteobacteria bacterium]
MWGVNAVDIEAEIPRLRRYARALTREAVAADDLVQDTLERAWGRLHLWRRGSNLRAWLFTILHNLHANQVRAAKARPELTTLTEWEVSGSRRPEQEDGLKVRGLAQALAVLPEEQRQVVLLGGLEDMTYEQVAEVLGIPIGTVMSRLSRGRERLRRLLAGEEQPVVARGLE